MLVREFRQEDSGELYSIVLQSFDEEYDPSVFFYFHSQWPSGQLVSCDFTGKPIGFISSVRNGSRARIMLLAVDRMYRNRGIGQELLDRFRMNCTMSGVTMITLEVRPSNTGARRFYARNGFKETEILKNYYQDGGDGIRLDGPTNNLS